MLSHPSGMTVRSLQAAFARPKEVNAAHARRRGPGERDNAELKNWRILRRRASDLVAAVQTLMIPNA